MRNLMLSAISKDTFLKLALTATEDFRRLHREGIAVSGTSSVDNLSGVKAAIADSGIGKELSNAIMNMLAIAVGEAKTTRRPTGKELEKQFLTFVSYAVVVPLRNRNHHKYIIGDPVVMILGCPGADTGMYGMDARGVVGGPGNELPRLRKSLRPATNAEIFGIVDKLYR